MKRMLTALCVCALCLPGCAGQVQPLPQEEFFKPEIYESAPMPQVVVPVERTAEEADLIALKAPPDLTVQCGGEKIKTSSPGFTWVNTMPTGERAQLIACGPHPSQMKENLTALETTEETATLVFEYAPKEKYVYAWPDDCTPECDCASIPVPVKGGVIELLPGGHLYEVTASWGDGETAGGTGTHVFYVIRSEESQSNTD